MGLGMQPRLSPPRRSLQAQFSEDETPPEYDRSQYPFYPPTYSAERREVSPPRPLPPSPPKPARSYVTPYLFAERDKPPRRTGLAYDPRMLAHKNLDDDHDPHPENPERVRKVWETLQREGLVERCQRIPCRDATIEELALFHSKEMISHIIRTKGTLFVVPRSTAYANPLDQK